MNNKQCVNLRPRPIYSSLLSAEPSSWKVEPQEVLSNYSIYWIDWSSPLIQAFSFNETPLTWDYIAVLSKISFSNWLKINSQKIKSVKSKQKIKQFYNPVLWNNWLSYVGRYFTSTHDPELRNRVWVLRRAVTIQPKNEQKVNKEV